MIIGFEKDPMRYNGEFQRIIELCKDTKYMMQNTEYLRKYFQKEKNIEMLRESLSTADNIECINIISHLNLKILPQENIKKNSYISLFWLNQLKIISDTEMEELSRKFQVVKDYVQIHEEAEEVYFSYMISQFKMEKYKKESVEKNPDIKDLRLKKKNIDDYKEIFLNVDDYVNLREICKYIQDLRDTIFSLKNEWKTLRTNSTDNFFMQKKEILRKIRINLVGKRIYPLKMYPEVLVDGIEKIKKIVNRMIGGRIKFCLCTYGELSDIVAVVWCYVKSVDLVNLVRLDENEKIVTSEGNLIFGKNGLSKALLEKYIEEVRKKTE